VRKTDCELEKALNDHRPVNIEIMANEINPASARPKTPIWARMIGFPFWPARFCSEYEEFTLREKRAPRPNNPQVAVSFLGHRCEKGWVGEAMVVEFTAESLSSKCFQEKKFRSDKDYRAAVAEAVRLCLAAGMSFPQDILTMVMNSNKVCYRNLLVAASSNGIFWRVPSSLYFSTIDVQSS
jgi:PWWP domain